MLKQEEDFRLYVTEYVSHLYGFGRSIYKLLTDEALSFNHQYIGTEHLLVGLLREQEGLAALALEKLGVALDLVRAAVEEKIGCGD